MGRFVKVLIGVALGLVTFAIIGILEIIQMGARAGAVVGPLGNVLGLMDPGFSWVAALISIVFALAVGFFAFGAVRVRSRWLGPLTFLSGLITMLVLIVIGALQTLVPSALLSRLEWLFRWDNIAVNASSSIAVYFVIASYAVVAVAGIANSKTKQAEAQARV